MCARVNVWLCVCVCVHARVGSYVYPGVIVHVYAHAHNLPLVEFLFPPPHFKLSGHLFLDILGPFFFLLECRVGVLIYFSQDLTSKYQSTASDFFFS